MNYCTNINMATIFMNTENSNASKPNKIVLSLLQRLDLRSSNKHVALQRQQHKNNQLKIIATTWNVFELPGGSYSVLYIQDYIEHIIKKHKTFSDNPPVHIYINRIYNRLVLKIKDGHTLELQTPETMKLFSRTKKLTGKKNGKNLASLEVVEVVLVQCNLVHNQYQQKSAVFYFFMPNISYGCLLSIMIFSI